MPPSAAVTPALEAQLAACSVSAGASRGARSAPGEAPDFGDGGAFPDVHVIQYPLQMGAGKLGPGGIPPRLDIDYQQLQGAAGRALLACGGGATEEHDALCAFLKTHAGAPLEGLPGAVRIRRVADVSPDEVAECLQGAGRPLVVTDALRDWPAAQQWTPELLLRRYGGDQVFANDRAPARHADKANGRPQRTAGVSFADYLAYYRGCGASPGVEGGAAPFYLNGWRAFSDHPELESECPTPYFMRGVDHTQEILQQVDAQLLRGTGGASAGAWYRRMGASLFKLFLGPAGTVTRLHADAGDAHGWLAQLWGAKLFVLYPPADAPHLRLIPTETETAQGDVEPLAPPGDARAPGPQATPHVALLQPGEAIIVPRGWWHYAAAVSPSLTAQANFFCVGTNAEGLVKIVVQQLRAAKSGLAARAPRA